MDREQILADMRIGFEADRDKYFAVADTLPNQSKYDEYAEELAELNQKWRDVPDQIFYPEIIHPMELPDWFPSEKVKFTSFFTENYVNERIVETSYMEEDEEELEEPDWDSLEYETGASEA